MVGDSKILIVEDDADVLRAARIALSRDIGHVETTSCLDGLEKLLPSATFDCVLLDMNFLAGARSGKEGLDALARIQTFDRNLAVVLMTAYGGVELAVEALKRGAVDFVLKPWRNEKLITSVIGAVENTRMRREAETIGLDALERDAIERALVRYAGNISQAASALGLSRPALYRRMLKHGF